jgi:hypothetical protein
VIGELDRVAHQIEQDLGEPLVVAMPDRQPGRHLGAKGYALGLGQGFDDAHHAVDQPSME